MFTTQEKKNLKKLLSCAVNKDEALAIDGVHGFLYGLAITPDTILPSEWMQGIFGEEMVELKNKEEVDELFGNLFTAYNRIVQQNTEGKLSFPFDIATLKAKDIQRMRDWARGFFLSTSLRPHVWGMEGEGEDLDGDEPEDDYFEGDEEEDEITACHAVIMGVAFPERIPELFRGTKKGSDGKEDSNLEASLFAMLPDAVASLQEHANAYREGMRTRKTDNYPAPPHPRRVVKVGRNAPCPCGSGSKYKKCCGK